MAASRCVRRMGAFTLVELLVVIGIVGVLVSLLLPSLAGAHGLARQTRELAASQQLLTSFNAYANDARDAILPGYPPKEWVNGRMEVRATDGTRLFNEQAQRYPFRLAPWLGDDFRALYNDQRLLSEIRENPQQYTPFGVDENYILSLYPALGMNVAFVGGSEKFQAWDPLFKQFFGRAHLERLDQSRRPSGVMAFVSARGDQQSGVAIIRNAEGFFRVEPPRFAAAQGLRWSAAYDARAEATGTNSGFVSLRHFGKAIASHLDGHALALGWEDLQDMRRWADQATSPDWGVGQ